MRLSKIQLQNFRSYKDFAVEFDPGVTIITGQNGSGKTNLLEAVYLLCQGKSFRDSDEFLTHHGETWWKIAGVIDDKPRESRYSRDIKTFVIDNKSVKRLSNVTKIPVVLFEPDDLMLVHGSPQARRKYIDHVIASVTPGYATTLRKYERVLAQRNRLLKSPDARREDFFVWDIMLAEEAEKIAARRRQMVMVWNELLSPAYSSIAGIDTAIDATYKTTIQAEAYKQTLMSVLQSQHQKDITLGTTTVGPHRDDIEFNLQGKSFVVNASRGEVRSLLLSLKNTEAALLEKRYLHPPLLLFDDVFSELDAQRQKHIITNSDRQIIITSTSSAHGVRGVNTVHLGQD